MPESAGPITEGSSRSGGPPGAHVTHAERNGVHVFRYFGKIDYMSAPAIQRFLDDLIEHGHIAGVVFDLTCADALDSTSLGLLARVNERVRDVSSSESMIVSKTGDIADVLYSMGFDQSFDMVTESEAPAAPARDIDCPRPTQAELHKTMLEAHRALVRLSEAGRLQFQDVVACLEIDSPTR